MPFVLTVKAVQNVKEFEKEIDELTYSLALATKSDLKQIEQVWVNGDVPAFTRFN